MCGGTGLDDRPAPAWEGLSPRVRGNLDALAYALRDDRSIPACAGEPQGDRLNERPCAVYPRVCGGTANGQLAHSPPGGLSPRVRGNQFAPSCASLDGGSIPACAGEPPCAIAGRISIWVYPRVCGGTTYTRNTAGTEVGLSPRVRGNRPGVGGTKTETGSIPACAGEPATNLPSGGTLRVYPRVCGGTMVRAIIMRGILGLSPRVRGNRRLPAPRTSGNRSIPACAGEPPVCASGVKRAGVYPRVCGGTRVCATESSADKGLSPRVRGNPLPGRVESSPGRSIPACAGEPYWGVMVRRCPGVYPRVCGGTTAARCPAPPE